ncbi:MAG: T9SS type A sorting domain-containing protein, partial [Crocinitomicaceae bacterium]|nr:T9SS type A sorting domain-containing protein [Crocinitomicaceae bacterium]
WTLIQTILPTTIADPSSFGHCVAIDGDNMLVGSYAGSTDVNDLNPIGAAGMVWAYTYDAVNFPAAPWQETQVIVDPSRKYTDYFGGGVEVDGNFMVVTAGQDDFDEIEADSLYKAGAAFAYELIAGTWTLIQKFVASDREAGDQFGWMDKIAISGSRILVSAYYEEEDVAGLNPLDDAGSAYFFEILPISSLPVELVEFQAECIDENTSLTWSTFTESHNDYFTIERSRDGVNFELVATVNGMGTTTTSQHYSWRDNNDNSGTSYYRLSQTDLDGASEVFTTISTNCDLGSSISIYPNPFENEFKIVSELGGTIKLMDNMGKVILEQEIVAGNNSIQTDRIASGAYMVFIILENGNQEVYKVIKH